MINRKIASEIAVGIILLIAIVVGGIFWLQNKKVQAPVIQSSPVTTQSVSQTKSNQAPQQPIGLIPKSYDDENVQWYEMPKIVTGIDLLDLLHFKQRC
ncbi:MAG: hypothetical protein UR99_C0013G0001 [Candidatus Moranbacteria bacterium GW2011_GWD2_36_12]|nr:MAG: hypothetical protein UR99_C0013G0001 [Candidatus Moranbacteria bacterium GW2011_GWD2_36_12]KKQ06498.1 MAG: hypothetical protein US16_C0016G0016 [Candidatus Moranbacteria bacterium GW2011_GWE2_36_40]